MNHSNQKCFTTNEKHSIIVSIIVPTYKRVNYLKKTIKSIMNQTFQNFEIIVVDDDPDSSLSENIEIFKDKRVRYFKNKKNQGAPFSRNFGAEKANGKYLAFLDDDDVWLPTKLEKQIDRFLNLNADYGVVYCGYDCLFTDQIKKKKNDYHTIDNINEIALKHCPVGSPTPLIKKHFFNAVGGFDVLIPSCQDWDLWIRLSKICKFNPVKESLSLYRVHGDQISNDILKKIDGRKIILKKYYEDISKYPEIISWHYRRLGSLYTLLNETQSARYYYIESIKSYKYNWGSWIHFFLNIFNASLDKWFIERYGIKTIGGLKIIN